MAKTRHEDVQSHIRSQPEFEDSERLAVLYSNILPLKERNRTSFDTIVAWWHQLLLSLIPRLSDDQLVLHASVELLDVLAAQDIGRPISLGVVIDQMSTADSPSLVKLADFLQSSAPIATRHGGSWPQWLASNLIARPLWWSFGQLNLVDSCPGQSISHALASWQRNRCDWVAVELVAREAKKVIKAFQDAGQATSLDRLYSLQQFHAQLCPHLSSLDVRILLKFLARDEGVLLLDAKHSVIKWRPNASPQGAIDPVSDTEASIVQLRSAKEQLESQIAKLESRIQDQQERVSNAVSKKQMERAKTLLRLKKGMQDLLAKRQGSLSTLESVWLGVERASGDVEMLRAYENASTTLKSLLQAPEFATADKTVETLSEAMADQQELEDTLALGRKAPGAPEVDEEDLLQELEQLKGEQTGPQADSKSDKAPEQKTAGGVQDVQLPQVPTEHPAPTSREEQRAALPAQ